MVRKTIHDDDGPICRSIMRAGSSEPSGFESDSGSSLFLSVDLNLCSKFLHDGSDAINKTKD